MEKIEATPYALVFKVMQLFEIDADITKIKGFYTTVNVANNPVYRPSFIKPRMIAIYLMRRYTELYTKEIGAIFNISHSAVSHATMWAEQMLLNNDKEYASKIIELDKRCDEIFKKSKRYAQQKSTWETTYSVVAKRRVFAGRNHV